MAETEGGPHRRRRDATVTRLALLAAARRLVTERGVEGTSTRDVAAAVGVNQALVYRYFGSKEKLFAEAAGSAMREAENLVADTPLAELPGVLLGRILDATGTDAMAGGFSALVTAANDDTIRDLIRDRVEAAFSTQLAGRLEGPDAALRAELFAAMVTGIGFLRGKVGTRALAQADRETLGRYVDQVAITLFGGQPRRD